MSSPFYPDNAEPKKSAAKITIQKYYLPSGESTQLSGVKSDIVMDSANEFLPIGEADLKNALSWDKIGQSILGGQLQNLNTMTQCLVYCEIKA